jgi:hypothetical protein
MKIKANSIFFIFLHALSSLKVENFKRREMVVITFSMQKSLIFLKILNVHSFVDKENTSVATSGTNFDSMEHKMHKINI